MAPRARFRAISAWPRGHTVSVRVGFHDFRRDLVLKKNEHPLVSREPGIHLGEEIIYAPSTDVDLPVVSQRDQREMQGRLGADYFFNELYRPIHASRVSPRWLNILISRTGAQNRVKKPKRGDAGE
jgi:hypothetical protein